jgi:hypothetical protein
VVRWWFLLEQLIIMMAVEVGNDADGEQGCGWRAGRG